MTSQRITIEEYVNQYLVNKYSGDFKIVSIERNANVTNIGDRNTYAIKVYSELHQGEFLLFVNEKPTFEVVDDLYTSLLIQVQLQSTIEEQVDFPGKVFVYLDNLDKSARESYIEKSDYEQILAQSEIATLRVFLLIKTALSGPEASASDVNVILNEIFKCNAKDVHVECIFYSGDSNLEIEDYQVDRSKNFDNRFLAPQDIIATWLGSFRKKTDDFSSKMRKIKY